MGRSVGTVGRRSVVAMALCAAVLSVGLSACTTGIVFTVTSTADAVDAVPGDGSCATAAHECTLRAAVQEANHAAQQVRIVLAPGARYSLSIMGADEDAAATGDLDVATTVTIEGHGATIDAGNIDRAIEAVGAAELTIDHLTLTHGSAAAGGGLMVDRSARAGLDHASVTDNLATGTIMCTHIDELNIDLGCSTSYDGFIGGGGIYSAGTLSMNASTVSDNRAAIDASGCHQEPFVLKAVTYTATVCVSSQGGGVTSWGHLGIVNSTISGNQAGSATGQVDAGGSGGGMFLATTSSLTSSVVLSTIADNRADHGSALDGPITLESTIVASTTGAACTSATDTASHDWNLGSDDTCGLTRKHDHASTDPQLGPLADNGGATLTHLPALTSPAVGAVGRGTPGLCDGTIPDQRDLARPSGRNCTIGSVEHQTTDP